MLYMALYPDRKGNIFNETVLSRFPNRLAEILPEAAPWQNAIWVIDTPDTISQSALYLNVDAMKQKAVCLAGNVKNDND
jgi:hypothetical protein